MIPDIDWIQLLPAWIAVCFGAIVQGTLGFGIALVASPLLLLLKPELIPGPMMFATFFLTSLIWWRERWAVHWQDLGWAWMGRIAGTLAGTAAMIALPTQLLIATMGFLIFLASVMSAYQRPFTLSAKLLIVAGFLSGLMGTMTSAGGPPMLLIFQHLPGPRTRATLSAFFTIGIVFSLASLATIGRFGTKELLMGLSFAPPILLGFLLSNQLIAQVNKNLLRNITLGFSALSGLLIAIESLWS